MISLGYAEIALVVSWTVSIVVVYNEVRKGNSRYGWRGMFLPVILGVPGLVLFLYKFRNKDIRGKKLKR